MPILLKNKFKIGDLAPKGSDGYAFAQIVNLTHSGLTMGVMLEIEVGEASGTYYERWQRGENTPTKIVDVQPMKVVELWGQKPLDGESIGEAMRRTTYQYLLDEGYFEGEIVNNPPLPPEEAEPETAADPEPSAEQPAAAEEAPSEAAEAEQPAEPTTDAPPETPAEGEQLEQPAQDAPAAEDAPAETEPTEPVPSPS